MKREKPVYLLVADNSLSPALRKLPSATADEYLEGEGSALKENAVVLNLCRSYQYLSKGYYVSLLADARGQRVFPTVEMIEQINNPFAYFRYLREAGLDTIDFKVLRGGKRLLPKVIVPDPDRAQVLQQPAGNGAGGAQGPPRYKKSEQTYQEVTAIFGRPLDKRFRRQAAAIFKVYSFPLLRIRMYNDEDGWKVGQIFPTSLQQLSKEEAEYFSEQLTRGDFVSTAQVSEQTKPQRIACLFDEKDPYKPSWEDTLEKFERVALKQGAMFEIITKNDLAHLPEYDALFIRTVTAIDHFSFTFAQRAESLGMPVIDDPQSILKCSNKVYLHELFQREGVPTPKTITVSRRTKLEEIHELGFPLIVKLPQGTFSAAVKKADNDKELRVILREMFKDSPLLIVQEFTPTPFDWRICILEGKILFACKYHQAKDHWQIARRFASGFTRFGKVEAVAIGKVPAKVKQVALKGAELIGDGLYGVDLKETEAGPLMIEINDNPNIETGYEDTIEKDRVYKQIVRTFLRRIHLQSKMPKPS